MYTKWRVNNIWVTRRRRRNYKKCSLLGSAFCIHIYSGDRLSVRFFFFFISLKQDFQTIYHIVWTALLGGGGGGNNARSYNRRVEICRVRARTCVPRKNHRAVIAKFNYRLDANILENQVNPTLVDRLNVDFKRTV